MAETPVLQVEDLKTHLPSNRGPVRAVDGVSFTVDPGEIVGIVGESGCGKSTLCSSLVRLLPTGTMVSGSIRFRGEDLLAKSPAEMRALRGRDITMIQQNPMTALDPVFTVGSQIREVLKFNARLDARARQANAVEMLRQVHIPSPEERLSNYPHQMSGGMKQRVLAALATALKPGLLLADEPTTALDVTIQEQILGLLAEIRDRQGTAIILVTHDLGVVRRLCDKVLIMYAGRVVETGPTRRIFGTPEHPYTRALLASIPHMGDTRRRLQAIEGTIPDLRDLPPGCSFAPRCPHVHARCTEAYPPEFPVGGGHARCWLHAPERVQ
ncbi:MAG: ABC transporter ATP-binding protein [Alphaproteobacteria bacterium]